MSRPTKRSSLETLKRPRLAALAKHFEVEASSRSKHEELATALVSDRSVKLGLALAELKRDELKAICESHGLESSGTKALLVARILGEEPEPTNAKAPKSNVTTPKPKKKAAKSKKAKKSADNNGGVLGFEAELFGMADQLWTNSGLQPSEYSTPVLALVFLKYATQWPPIQRAVPRGGQHDSSCSREDIVQWSNSMTSKFEQKFARLMPAGLA